MYFSLKTVFAAWRTHYAQRTLCCERRLFCLSVCYTRILYCVKTWWYDLTMVHIC